jgi:predicted protein tyrosine phosphatase
VIVAMERTHRSKAQRRFRSVLNGKRIICLDLPDEFEFMAPNLLALLQTRLARYFPQG